MDKNIVDQQEITQNAIHFAHKNKKQIVQEILNKGKYEKSLSPVSVFMAGAPGAGKTEFSKTLLDRLGESMDPATLLRIDLDEYRAFFPQYDGENSALFQGACSIVAEKLHDTALEKGYSFIFDGTLSNYEKARLNVHRSLKRSRDVVIIFIYQYPQVSWDFTKTREKIEKRNIPKNVFIREFIESRKNVELLKKEFGSRLNVWLIHKNIDPNNLFFDFHLNVESIDKYIKSAYTIQTLEEELQ
ncbi:MAG: zeta toxin family protein [Candidatus Kerfeldbacteria bacterium]|nr:zeta toxin family protein [Candidatus Kerfeldbacteria bacterium]